MAGATQMFNRLGFLGLGLVVGGSVINTALYNVDGGQRAVIFDRFKGVRDHVVGEGTHFIIPWVQRPIIFDIRSRPRSVPTITGSKDLQNVNITLRILFRPVPSQLPKIYTTLGVDYDERVLPSIVNEVLKAVVAQYDAGELITQREMVSQKIQEDLIERATQFGFVMDDMSITHLTFGRDFTHAVELKQVQQQEAEAARYLVEKTHLTFGADFTMAVEKKQVAQQDAEKAKYVVDREEQKKQAAIIRAEGDSQAALLLSAALATAGEGLIELRKLEAAEDVAYQLAQSPNISYLPPNQQMLLHVPSGH